MIKAALRYVGLGLLLAVCLVEGFFFSDYLNLRKENNELKNIVTSALDLADRRTGSIDACMSSLVSCTRVIDYEHPRVYEQMLRSQVAGAEPKVRGSHGSAQ